VQFLDLHEEFKNTRALTLMASKLEEVLEIEAADLYIKRPARPMVTIELRDISKLARYIRIPSMVEGTEDTVTIAQKNLYSGLPNQCKKCRCFGHHARACITNRNKPWEGAPTPNPLTSKGANGRESGGAGAPHPRNTQADKKFRAQNARRSQESAGMNHKQPKASKQTGHPAQPNIRTSFDALPNAEVIKKKHKGSLRKLGIRPGYGGPNNPPRPQARQAKPNDQNSLREPSPRATKLWFQVESSSSNISLGR
jgi:hypothetical protein